MALKIFRVWSKIGMENCFSKTGCQVVLVDCKWNIINDLIGIP